MNAQQQEWFVRQGLATRLDATPADVARRYGWLRSVGSANPYLAIHARTGASRAEIEKAVEDLELVELPAARGCTYYVPREEAALALRLAATGTCDAEFRMAERHLDVTEAEVGGLADAIVRALEEGPMDPRTITARVSPRHLGDVGKKRGLTSTLSLGLSRLQVEGRIRRLPQGGRLDTERFRYALWPDGPRPGGIDEETLARELAARYFRWAAPATDKEFREFTGLSARAVREATIAVGPDPMGAFAQSSGRVVLLSSLDPWIHLRRNMATLLDPADDERRIPFGSDMKDATSLRELDSHPIVMDGVIVGLWEFDHERQEIAAWTWRPCAAIDAAVEETGDWIARELGDFRSFSLDSPTSRRQRIELLRSLT